MLKVSSLYFYMIQLSVSSIYCYLIKQFINNEFVLYPTPVHQVYFHICYQTLMASHQIIKFNYQQWFNQGYASTRCIVSVSELVTFRITGLLHSERSLISIYVHWRDCLRNQPVTAPFQILHFSYRKWSFINLQNWPKTIPIF